uniref:Uncharacterized protein n=1 Tax=Salix viminalis TaxID=40686 RepID=A0A6N2LCE3_SALVM
MRGATRGLPRRYYSRPSTFNCGVLMGSGAFSAGNDRTRKHMHDEIAISTATPDLIPTTAEEGRRIVALDFARSFRRAVFSCSSYGIATVTGRL